MFVFRPDIARLRAKRDVPGLIELLGHQDLGIARGAAEALGEISAEDNTLAAREVSRLLDLDSVLARSGLWGAMLKGVKQSGARAVRELVKDLNKPGLNREFPVREMGWLAEPSAVEPLAAVLRDREVLLWAPQRSIDLHIAAIWALGRIGTPEAAAALTIALEDPEAQVRGASAEELGRIGDARAVEPLTRALEDDDRTVRTSANRALVTIRRRARPQGATE